MALSWNEIRDRAFRFSKAWQGESRERAEKDTFWNEFFDVFGKTRRSLAVYEQSVKKLGERQGFIDLFWKGTLLVEHKSKGENLDAAFEQATDYFHGIKEVDLPRFVLVSDFAHFRLFDLDAGTHHEFALEELPKHITLFGFIAGYKKHEYKEQDPVNIKAAELMGKLHDQLEESGYVGHQLEILLVRMLFCLFAEDTTLFEQDLFREFLEEKTREDGTDTGSVLTHLFQTLDTDIHLRSKTLDEHHKAFPYVNGNLFSENLRIPDFNARMREILLECSSLDWGKISPAIFGSMFQSVMNPQERRNLGAHYTSEKNIMKVIEPLFLDDLKAEFERVKGKRKQLEEFHAKLANLRFLDPACGCGNFLIITYRELRKLELEVIKTLLFKHEKLSEGGQGYASVNVDLLVKVNVDQFYGIEYDEFPARIAEVALWLIDHQMNMAVSEAFGKAYGRLPLKAAAKILNGDALAVDWETLVPKASLSYILGNPPFIGSKLMKVHQRAAIGKLFGGLAGSGNLDYVAGWYIKAGEFIQGTKIKVGFVSTNSIVQGEQTSVLWGRMLDKYKVTIHFAHRTFKWSNEAKGKAAVFCVIIGFASFDTSPKWLFDYEDIKGDAHKREARNINPYLVVANNVLIGSRSNPICTVPKMSFGNMPLDGGNLILADEEKTAFLELEPNAEKFIRPLISAKEFLNGGKRWCFWLVDAEPSDVRHLPELMKRIEAVRKFRLASIAPSTQKFASTPSLFRDKNVSDIYIVVPCHSSEIRAYIPMGFLGKDSIVSNSCMAIPNGNLFHFGVLMSQMHMAWVRHVCGRIKSDFRYSKDIVYNNYPWPSSPTDKQIEAVKKAAQSVLDARLAFPKSSLADLYHPSTMPSALVKAHAVLDKAVDGCYSGQSFTTDALRMEFLFGLYGNLSNPLLPPPGKGKKK
jgi:hypothetical protein